MDKNFSETDNEQMDNNGYYEKYIKNTYIIGRIGVSILLLLFFSAPFMYSAILGTTIDMEAFWKAFAQIIVIWGPSSIVEFLVYTPILGAGGTFLAFTTGNLINLKIPCVANARELSGAKAGSPENEVISTLSIASSALVTTIILALGVLLLIPLQGFLSNPLLVPAFDNVVPALFGAFAYRYISKNIKLSVFPLVIMCAVFLIVPSLIKQITFMIIPSGALTILIAWIMFKKEK